MADPPGDQRVERVLVDRGEEARDVQVERPRGPPAVRRRAAEKRHQPVARSERALAAAAGERVVDEDALEERLLVRDEEVVDDAVAEIGGEDLARLRARGDEADGRPRAVGVGAQLLLEAEQVRLRVRLEGERGQRAALAPAAGAVLPPERLERKEVGPITSRHAPPGRSTAELPVRRAAQGRVAPRAGGGSRTSIAHPRGPRHTSRVASTRKFAYTVVLEEDPRGHWHAYAPAVPGCFGGGRTRAQAVRQYRAALKLHVEELRALGGRVPVERRSPAVRVVVAA
jgi:predicted RNase H-like HicB family nuclease